MAETLLLAAALGGGVVYLLKGSTPPVDVPTGDAKATVDPIASLAGDDAAIVQDPLTTDDFTYTEVQEPNVNPGPANVDPVDETDNANLATDGGHEQSSNVTTSGQPPAEPSTPLMNVGDTTSTNDINSWTMAEVIGPIADYGPTPFQTDVGMGVIPLDAARLAIINNGGVRPMEDTYIATDPPQTDPLQNTAPTNASSGPPVVAPPAVTPPPALPPAFDDVGFADTKALMLAKDTVLHAEDFMVASRFYERMVSGLRDPTAAYTSMQSIGNLPADIRQATPTQLVAEHGPPQTSYDGALLHNKAKGWGELVVPYLNDIIAAQITAVWEPSTAPLPGLLGAATTTRLGPMTTSKTISDVSLSLLTTMFRHAVPVDRYYNVHFATSLADAGLAGFVFDFKEMQGIAGKGNVFVYHRNFYIGKSEVFVQSQLNVAGWTALFAATHARNIEHTDRGFDEVAAHDRFTRLFKTQYGVS